MKKLLIAIVLLFATNSFAQHRFELNDASKYFDIKVDVAKCDDMYCEGRASFSFYKKHGTTPYQVVILADTQIELENGGKPLVNVNLLYDHQSVVNIGDYNFDGMEDVAICDGANGSYNSPSYRIYLSSRAAGNFVYNAALTALAKHLGMFNVDPDKKTIETFDKSGCCWHITERYSVVKDRPVKIFEMIEDGLIKDETRIKVTTKTLKNGKWRSSVRYEKREE